MKQKLIVSGQGGETRVALLEAPGKPSEAIRVPPSAKTLEEWRVAELYLERAHTRSMAGNIYRGKVDNVIPGLEAAFVDIGLTKNGFLHMDEIVVAGKRIPKRGAGSSKDARISDLLKAGQEVIVQVIKDPLKSKGPRLSMDISLAGRYMVYMPHGKGVGTSRKLTDRQRDVLRKRVQGVDLGDGGIIVRTAGQGIKKADFQREVSYLRLLDKKVTERNRRAKGPTLLFQEAELPIRLMRDMLATQLEGMVFDQKEQYQHMISFLERTAPDLIPRIKLYKGKNSLFETYRITPVIDSLFSKRVDLPSGGYLVIEYTEALTVIDVNSGSFTGRGKRTRLEDTITKTNLEAAQATIEQLRLRDIGGIIVIDFIDMAKARNREAVQKALEEVLAHDRAKSSVMAISQLGLVEMTRQNVSEGVRELMVEECPMCTGHGVVHSQETLALDCYRMLEAAITGKKSKAYLVSASPEVVEMFTRHGHRLLHRLQEATHKTLYFVRTPGTLQDDIHILDHGPIAKVAPRSAPFKIGEEVWAKVSEPHMYDEGAAVAIVSDYPISLPGGIDQVGNHCLIRLDELRPASGRGTIIQTEEN